MRPDYMRFASARPPTDEQWWEWGALFHGANVNKRGITLDLTQPAGVETLERLAATADVLVENYTPRVMEQFGLGWERLHEVNPDLIMVRMPAFGLERPVAGPDRVRPDHGVPDRHGLADRVPRRPTGPGPGGL